MGSFLDFLIHLVHLKGLLCLNCFDSDTKVATFRIQKHTVLSAILTWAIDLVTKRSRICVLDQFIVQTGRLRDLVCSLPVSALTEEPTGYTKHHLLLVIDVDLKLTETFKSASSQVLKRQVENQITVLSCYLDFSPPISWNRRTCSPYGRPNPMLFWVCGTSQILFSGSLFKTSYSFLHVVLDQVHISFHCHRIKVTVSKTPDDVEHHPSFAQQGHNNHGRHR